MLMILLQSMEVVVLIATGSYVAYQTHRHFSLARSGYYIERFNSGEMREFRKRVDAWVERGQPCENVFRNAASSDDETFRDIEALRLFANFFQELGTAYKHRTINRRYIWDVFGSLVLRYAEILAPYVCDMRDHRQRQTLYIDFELMVESIQRMDAKRVKSTRTCTWFSEHRRRKNV